jgi:hypothetical protein
MKRRLLPVLATDSQSHSLVIVTGKTKIVSKRDKKIKTEPY